VTRNLIFLLCLLFLFVIGESGAQGAAPNTWIATSSTGLTLRGTWTAAPGPTSETVTGTFTVVDAQGRTAASGGWSAAKSSSRWSGAWRAVIYGSKPEYTGTWRAGVDLKRNAPFADLFEKAVQTVVSGSWRAGRYSGTWSIRAFK
jgi:hypothetical protein